MPYHPNKQDLARLKKSKPIPIVAHTGEAVIPVVYADMVNKFLDKQGIHLPLTHHKLAEFKAEAGVSGYAVGTTELKKKKSTSQDGQAKRKKKKKGKIYKDKSVNITINVGAGGGGGGKGKGGGFGRGRGGGGGFRGFRYNSAAPYDPTKQTDITAKIITDYNKLLEEQKRAEEKNKALSTVSVASTEAIQDKLPIHFSTKSVPFRPNSFDSLATIEQEESKYAMPAVSGNTNTGSSSSSNLGGFFDDIINVPQFNIDLPPLEPTSKAEQLFDKYKVNVAGEDVIQYVGGKVNPKHEFVEKLNKQFEKNKEDRERKQREREEKLPPTAPSSPTAKYSLKNEFFNEREIPSNPNPSSLLAKPPNYLKPTVSSLKAKEHIEELKEEKKEPVNKKQLIEDLKEAEKQKPSKVRFTPPFQMVMRVTEYMGDWLKRRRERAKELGKEKEEAEFQSNPKFAKKHWGKMKEDIVWSNR